MEDNYKRYIKIWWTLTVRTSQVAFSSRIGAMGFLIGKVIRFVFFLFFLFVLITKTKSIGGYSLWQMILFFLTFNVVDILAQFFLREVYRFRTYIISGQFDYHLTKPISPLFRSLFGGSDILDLLTFFPLLFFLMYTLTKIGDVTLAGIFLYIFLLMNGFVIALSFHIFILSLGIITTEVDNVIWIFRDMTNLGRVPVDIYRDPIRFLLTFFVPVAVMITFPSKALFGAASSDMILLALCFSTVLLAASLWCWQYALKYYASVS